MLLVAGQRLQGGPSRAARAWPLWTGLIGLLSLSLHLACGGSERADPEQPAPQLKEIDLMAAPVCLIGGQLAHVPKEESSEVFIQPAGLPTDFILLLSGSSELVLEPVDLGHSPSVLLLTDDREHTIQLEVTGSGGWRGPLPEPAGTRALLRLEGPVDSPVRWRRLAVRGEWAGSEPLLPTAKPVDRPRPNVLIYVVDALRPDHLSLYGYPRPTSPKIDAFAERSSVFDRAYSTGANTSHSIPSLFTSLPPEESVGRLRRRRPGSVEHTIAELFREAGYATGGFQANRWLKAGLGFGRGFERYVVLPHRGPGGGRASALNKRALGWLDTVEGRPFFLFIQSYDVHNPYEVPPPFAGRFSQGESPAPPVLSFKPRNMSDAKFEAVQAMVSTQKPHHYDDAIAYADHHIGELLDQLAQRELLENTIVVITADHGESLGEGGRYLHGLSLHEEQIRIPLLIFVPWVESGRRHDALVSLLDIAPTLFALVGLPIPQQFRGTSLLATLPDHRPRAVSGKGDGWYLREGDWKLVLEGEGRALYDVSDDPGEKLNLLDTHPVTATYLEAQLWAGSRAYRETGFEMLPADHGLDEEERVELKRLLRVLGYIE